MITGYNTDVNHLSRAFHVQTEDKGTSNPYVESLIYVGGQVLAAKRTDYASILAQGNGDEAIIELMDQQHRSMILSIREGEFDERALELLGEAPEPREETQRPSDTGGSVTPAPSEAERSLDEVILEYLTTEALQEHLVVSLSGEVELALGQKHELVVCTATSKNAENVAGASVEIRMISTVAEPRILAAGVTDEKGRLCINLEIPDQDEGSSALVITASSDFGQAELKYLL